MNWHDSLLLYGGLTVQQISQLQLRLSGRFDVDVMVLWNLNLASPTGSAAHGAGMCEL